MERNTALDSLRGATIMFVVLNHCIRTVAVMPGWALPGIVYDMNNIVGLIRMPAFFLCSGILFAVASRRGWKWFLNVRLPWTFWIVALWGGVSVLLIRSGFNLYPWNPWTSPDTLQLLLIEPTGVLWFVYAIALCGAFCLAIRDFGPVAALTTAAAVSLGLIAADNLIAAPTGIHLVIWSLGTRGLLFFTLGFVFSKQFMSVPKGSLKGFLAAMLVWAVLAVAVHRLGMTDILRLIVGVPATLAAIYALRYMLDIFPSVASGLAFLGRRSLEIFLLHMFFVAGILYAIEGLTMTVHSAALLLAMFATAMMGSIATATLLRSAPGNPFFAIPKLAAPTALPSQKTRRQD